MPPEQVALVQASFATIVPLAGLLADLFYFRLFALDPSLRRLFARDMRAQKQAFTSMLQVMVDGLEQHASIEPSVELLGQRHLEYGVKDEDYLIVEQALLWALEQAQGEALAPPTREAWIVAYRQLATTMREAAAAVQAHDRPAAAPDAP